MRQKTTERSMWGREGTVGKALGMMGLSDAWWVERENGERLAGPFTTRDDAWRARDWVERALSPETFWIRDHPLLINGEKE